MTMVVVVMMVVVVVMMTMMDHGHVADDAMMIDDAGYY